MAVSGQKPDLARLLLENGHTAAWRAMRKTGSVIMFGNWKQVSLAVIGSVVLTATSVGAAIGPIPVARTTSPALAVTLVSGQAVI
jgi:hypothetical protein